MQATAEHYAARLNVDYPERLERLSTFFRIIWVVPIFIILNLISGTRGDTFANQGGDQSALNGGGLSAGLWLATMLMIVFRQRYPRWWFDFGRELTRFSTRVGVYFLLLTDQYPSTEDEQAVHLEIDYPDAKNGLNRWLPLVKWLLAIPHYLVLLILGIVAGLATVVAWFAILLTGRYPRPLFDFVVGVIRWSVRVGAYAFLLVTDRYPPFSLA